MDDQGEHAAMTDPTAREDQRLLGPRIQISVWGPKPIATGFTENQ
jgi:hypothetical protein